MTIRTLLFATAPTVIATFLLGLPACGDDDGSSPDAGGMAVCELVGGEPDPGACGPAPVELSPEICRCGSHWYWSGTACVATAACRCTAGCELLYETETACSAAYATCTADAGP